MTAEAAICSPAQTLYSSSWNCPWINQAGDLPFPCGPTLQMRMIHVAHLRYCQTCGTDADSSHSRPASLCLRCQLVDSHSGPRPEPWGIVRKPMGTLRRGLESLRAAV